MMQDFAATQKVLIINRLRSPSSDIGKFSQQAVQSYGQANTKFLLQGRDANTGQFRPSMASLSYGAQTAKLQKLVFHLFSHAYNTCCMHEKPPNSCFSSALLPISNAFSAFF